MEIKYVTVILSNPSRGDDVGSCAEVAKGENPVVIAKRLILKRHRLTKGDGVEGFERRISYERWSY
jgi:hypothetical protein